MSRAIDFGDRSIPSSSARTNALLELISDQLMYAALCNTETGTELNYKLGQEKKNVLDSIAARIIQVRKDLGFNP